MSTGRTGIGFALTREILRRLEGAPGLWLFLDYDGTLAEFAPTPDHVVPDPQVIRLVTQLAKQSKVRVGIISGRRLDHVKTLLPVPGVLLAGTYGVEMQHPKEGDIYPLDLKSIRPVLEAIKPSWSELLAGRQGFYLEDKGWTLAIHARYAGDTEAAQVLSAAHDQLKEARLGEEFRVLGGSKFLEIGPKLANKGQTVAYLLNRFPWPGALLVYAGDDDRDEEAFEVVKSQGGIPVLVAPQPRPTLAEHRLESPVEVRLWLQDLITHLDQISDP